MNKEEIKALIGDMCNECSLFRGNFDAVNDSLEYMYGISAVMTYLADMVSDEYSNSFSTMFSDNLTDCLNKIGVDNND